MRRRISEGSSNRGNDRRRGGRSGSASISESISSSNWGCFFFNPMADVYILCDRSRFGVHISSHSFMEGKLSKNDRNDKNVQRKGLCPTIGAQLHWRKPLLRSW